MVTDEMMDAIDMMIEICGSEEQAKGMRAIADMLGDFEEGSWLCMENPSDCYERLEKYLPCQKKSVFNREDFRPATTDEVRNIKAGDRFYAEVYNKELHDYVEIHEFIAGDDATYSRRWSICVKGFIEDANGNKIKQAVTAFDEAHIFVRKSGI